MVGKKTLPLHPILHTKQTIIRFKTDKNSIDNEKSNFVRIGNVHGVGVLIL